MLDVLSPAPRHLVLMLLAAVLTWAGTDALPWVKDQPGIVGILGGPLLTAAIAWGTTLTRRYGVGSGGGE